MAKSKSKKKKNSKRKTRRKKRSKDIYCGNNRLHPDVVSGRKNIGTRYGCLRKGIGAGLSLPADPSYLGPYQPIDNTRIYCGNQRRTPENYNRLGSISECLRKGVGIGKILKARQVLVHAQPPP